MISSADRNELFYHQNVKIRQVSFTEIEKEEYRQMKISINQATQKAKETAVQVIQQLKTDGCRLNLLDLQIKKTSRNIKILKGVASVEIILISILFLFVLYKKIRPFCI
jgi:hypothetical protein